VRRATWGGRRGAGTAGRRESGDMGREQRVARRCARPLARQHDVPSWRFPGVAATRRCGCPPLRFPRRAIRTCKLEVPSGERCPAKPSPPAGRARQRDSRPGRPFRQPLTSQSPQPQTQPHVPGRTSPKTGMGLGVGRGRLARRSMTMPGRKRARPFATDSMYGRPVDANRLAERAGARRLGALVVREKVCCARPPRVRPGPAPGPAGPPHVDPLFPPSSPAPRRPAVPAPCRPPHVVRLTSPAAPAVHPYR
jgi:hypothetical protein